MCVIVNMFGIGVIGGVFVIGFYLFVVFVGYCCFDWVIKLFDYFVLLLCVVFGLFVGFVFLWIFLFVFGLCELKNLMWSIWIVYMVVWFVYGMWFI